MIRNPLEQFQIIDLLSISFLNDTYKFSFTNVGLYITIATLSLLAANLIINNTINKQALLVSSSSLIQESTYDSILAVLRDQIGGAK